MTRPCLTPAELRKLARAVTRLFAPYHERTAKPSKRPARARAVRAAALLFPLPDDD